MITSGHFLIHSNGEPYEPYETTIGFSQDRDELVSEAEKRNKELEDALNRFKDVSEDIEKFENRFDDFKSLYAYKPSKEDFQEWISDNPIPKNMLEFVDFLEYHEGDEYTVYFHQTEEYELQEYYYVNSFGEKS